MPDIDTDVPLYTADTQLTIEQVVKLFRGVAEEDLKEFNDKESHNNILSALTTLFGDLVGEWDWIDYDEGEEEFDCLQKLTRIVNSKLKDVQLDVYTRDINEPEACEVADIS